MKDEKNVNFGHVTEMRRSEMSEVEVEVIWPCERTDALQSKH